MQAVKFNALYLLGPCGIEVTRIIFIYFCFFAHNKCHIQLVQELYKKVRGVLNKLTPQKFATLVSQVQALPIDTSERLQGVINLVFEKVRILDIETSCYIEIQM
jgi:hypothetical protein